MSETAKARKPRTSGVKVSNDGLINVASGLGTEKAKRSHNSWRFPILNSFAELDACYMSNWLARQIVEIPAEDMTREWREFKCKDAETLQKEEDRVSVAVSVQEAISWARLYGGAGILMLTGQPLDKPLVLSRVKKGDLKRLIVFDRWDMAAMTINTWNVMEENYLKPEFYNIRGGNQQIHWTHFARFNGARLPRRQMAITQGWGDSELRKCLDDIGDMVASKDGIAELMQEANVDVITREGLADELASDQDGAIVDRYATFSKMKSIVQLALLDGDETYDRKTLNLSGVAPILDTFMTWISGAADIPVTRLFGTSAKGLNATGDGDQNNYYDSIRSKQCHQLDPGIKMLDQVLVRSALGHMPADYQYIWSPLKQMNDLEAAQAELLRAQKDQLLIEMTAVRPSQVARRLQAADEYQYDEGDIEDMEADEEAGLGMPDEDFEDPAKDPPQDGMTQ